MKRVSKINVQLVILDDLRNGASSNVLIGSLVCVRCPHRVSMCLS